MKNNRSWFTLIELLVVITIIGILGTGSTALFTSQLQRARDAARIAAVSDLKTAAEQYNSVNYEYPVADTNFTDAVKDYIGKIPVDTKDWKPCNKMEASSDIDSAAKYDVMCRYVYAVGPDSNGIDNGVYEVSTAFEQEGSIKNNALSDAWEDALRYEAGNDASGISTKLNKDNTIENPTSGTGIISFKTGDTGGVVIESLQTP